MAIQSGFKRACPNCEAMVSVRDTSFIGKKIGCPKCKKPFVVEPEEDDAPLVDDVEEDEPAPSKKGAAKAGITAANGKGKSGIKGEKTSPKVKAGEDKAAAKGKGKGS